MNPEMQTAKTTMHRLLLLCFPILLLLGSCGDGATYAIIETDFGDIRVRLYDSTPQHRDNFVQLANEGYYDSLLFHRVVNGYIIQGGDPLSKEAAPDDYLGMGSPGYEIDAEIGEPHVRGALAAARTQNPQKRSNGSQFYLVQGQPVNGEILDRFEVQKNIKYTPEQRQRYLSLGGAPNLDGDYTVFGEVVDGLDVLDKIAAVPIGPADRPVADVRMRVRVE